MEQKQISVNNYLETYRKDYKIKVRVHPESDRLEVWSELKNGKLWMYQKPVDERKKKPSKMDIGCIGWILKTEMDIQRFLNMVDQSLAGDMAWVYQHYDMKMVYHTSLARQGVPRAFRNRKKREHRPFPYRERPANVFDWANEYLTSNLEHRWSLIDHKEADHDGL